MDWHRHLRIVLGVVGGGLAAIWLFVFAMNPYGNLPHTALATHVIMDDNQRFQYPAIIRSHRFDSTVIGTSTARLLDPKSLERMFGGHFANLALNDARAWEQWRLAELFQVEVTSPRTLVIGLDGVWCRPDADAIHITRRGFPEWMYDNDPWNDLVYLLNARAVEIAGRRLGNAMGLAKPRWPDDGFEVFTPPESAYDLARARSHIYEGRPAVLAAPYKPAFVPGPADRAEWQFPALAWLQSLTKGRFAKGVLVFMPVHASNQPAPDSPSAAMEAECKRQIAAIGNAADWPVIDFRIRSSITTDDTNYWDGLHYRLTIARRIEDGIARALATRQDDPAGDWRMLPP